MPENTPHHDVVAASVAAYSEHADAYAAHNADSMAAAAARFAGLLADGASILDAGCGPGRDLARFAALGHRPVGVDLNPDFVAIARTRGTAHLGDLRQLPFADNHFDAVWACASLVHLPEDDTTAALRELHRVTKAGGPVCVSVKQAGVTGWTESAHGRRWFQMWTPEAFEDAVRTAGFTVESTEAGPVFVDVWARA